MSVQCSSSSSQQCSTMAEKRKTKKKAQDIPLPVEEKPTKEEYSVANYLKKNCPTKKTKFLNHQVNYFSANKAVDVLLDSPWASGKDVLFTDRQSVVVYCNKLLKFKFFHRAKKIPITDKDLKPKELKKKKEKEKEEKKKKEQEKKKEKEEKKVKEEEKKKENDKDEAVLTEEEKKEGDEGAEDSKADVLTTDREDRDVKEKDGDKKKKKKSKIKLDMHLEQEFVDGADAYVWMYDPIPFWYYIAGGLLLCGAIAVCLFPLWPPTVRKGVYYLSLAAAGFLGVILSLVVIRFIVFVVIWVLTMGRHHLWLLPNLTEDVGFFASFWPLYHYEYRGEGYSKKKKKKKVKEADEKEDERKYEAEDTQDAQDTAADTDKPDTDVDRVGSEEQIMGSETDSENSNSQAFEMVEREDVIEEMGTQESTEEQEQEDKELEKEKEEEESGGTVGTRVEELKEDSASGAEEAQVTET